jgi:hypothetical protein
MSENRNCIVLTALLVTACAAPSAPSGPDLTADQFGSMVVGKKLHYVAADRPGLTADATYRPDGTLDGTWNMNSSSGHVAQTWKRDGDKVCNTDPKEGTHCVSFRQTGGGFAEVNLDGSLHGMDTVMQ